MGIREYLLGKISEDTKKEIVKEAIARFIKDNPEFVAELLKEVSQSPTARPIMAEIYHGFIRDLSEEELEKCAPELQKTHRGAIKNLKNKK